MKVFIGSSSEALSHARDVAAVLRSLGYEPKLWKDAFIAARSHLENLVSLANEADAAVFVFNEDDRSIVRDQEKPAVRANVLFEYGLFSGRLGCERACVVLVGKPDIANDIAGIKYVEWESKTFSVELSRWLEYIGPKQSPLPQAPLQQQAPLPRIDLRDNLEESLNSLLVKNAKRSLFVSGVNNVSVLGMKSLFVRRSADVSIRLLMTDLRNKALQACYKDLRSSKTDSEDTTGLMAYLTGASKNIEVRVADFMMPAFFVAADLPEKPGEPGGVILAFHALTDMQSDLRPSVMLTPEHGPWFERYREQIERIWNKAKPFQAQ